LEKISWIHLFVLILATFRLTHLIVYDKITAFIRRPFIEASGELDENGGPRQTIYIKGSGLKHWIGSLLSCHWCAGIWCSIIVILVYMYLPAAFPALIILAVAGAAALIESHVP
jgi:hypothetical protein